MLQTISFTSTPMMTAENFAYWLQGFFEITGDVKSLTPEQIKMIKDHLGYVFQHAPAHLPQPTPLQQVQVPYRPGLDELLGQWPSSPPVVTC